MMSTKTMNYLIDIQNATEKILPMSDEEIRDCVSLVLKNEKSKAELTIRLVNSDEMIHLNTTYRHQNKTTNVLAFPSKLPNVVELEHPFLGDIIICHQVLLEESQQLNKSLKSHWTLILIHGVLHLLGYDHIKDEDTAMMQAKEIELLQTMGYNNPYDTKDNNLE